MTRRNEKKVVVDLQSGKIPPHSKEVEQNVLGMIMVDKEAIDIALEILQPECFYNVAHVLIFEAMIECGKLGVVPNVLAVCQELMKRKTLETVGGMYYVTSLTNNVVHTYNLEHNCLVVKQMFLAREMIRISGETIYKAYEPGDVFNLIEEHELQLTKLTVNNSQKSFVKIDTALMKTVQRIEKLRHQDEHITGVPSGFIDLDRITHGWQPSDLVILAARPAVGKTAFALNLARNASMGHFKKVPVAVFSLEMSTEQLTQRLLSAESEINLDQLRNGRIDDNQMKHIYSEGVKSLAQAQIFIDDSAALNIFELRSRCRRLKRKHSIGLIIIDYLQLMSGVDNNGNREQEISKISRGLKQIAKELEVPIIALSQLSRAVESRKGEMKMPQLSDLRESGAIEQDADMVMFMYRPEYYDINENESGESTRGETHIKIAKHRNGSLETIKLTAKLWIQKFTNFEPGVPAALPAESGRWKSTLFIESNDDQPF